MTKARVLFAVNSAWCKRCGICIEFCPRKVFVEREDGYPEAANPDACTQCALCELLCPDQAMGLTVVEEQEAGSDAS
jgi:2-oxoglutarate ferredoxin oxidoreductase subunit delta